MLPRVVSVCVPDNLSLSEILAKTSVRLLVFSYAVFAGLNLSLFATGVVNASEAAVGLLLAPDSAELLERYIVRYPNHTACLPLFPNVTLS